jgi:hypothetical protein
MKLSKADLKKLILEALNASGGQATLIQIARHIWQHHEADLRDSGDLFFRWQYDMRWAANELRHDGKLAAADVTERGVWALKK